MSTKIRLMRLGKKKSPFYRIVVADSRSARNGKTVSQIGTYDPSASDGAKIVLKNSSIKDWISKGAVFSQTARQLLKGTEGLFQTPSKPDKKVRKRKGRGNPMSSKIELRKEKEALEKKKLAAAKKKEKEMEEAKKEAAAEQNAPSEGQESSVQVEASVEDKKE